MRIVATTATAGTPPARAKIGIDSHTDCGLNLDNLKNVGLVQVLIINLLTFGILL